MATEVKSGEVKPVAGNSLEEIKKAVNGRLATCKPVVIDGKPFGIEVDFKEKPAEVVKEGQEGQGPENKEGGKRNKRKTRSKRSARKSHKSRRVFGGKRK